MDRLLPVIEKHWGYRSFRPLQEEAMAAAVDGRDSLVVMPTGGGKSLCYQVPALLTEKPTVVVSPLIALMKDQVDGLLERGIPTAFFNSSLDTADRRLVSSGILEGGYRLVFVAPERFAGNTFFDLLDEAGVGTFAIDEAHCISHWGHDFRGDYRRLGQLKQRFPQASVHAFTATATPRVREDIIAQLGLSDPAVLVGDFFRPNLTYRIVRRGYGFNDVIDGVRARPGQCGIVYCIRRVDVDNVAAELEGLGVKAVGYHAGMSDDQRTRAQDAFASGRTDVVVATVAFGMGIDRADIRYVMHAAMPKSVEHYQQETGRAGRDGEPAECILFYSGADFRLWESIVRNNEATDLENQMGMLSAMYRLCTGASCRHRRLVTYFGQDWDRASCDACDICLGHVDVLPDSTVTAQKILSCVVRTGERFGAAHVVDVLRGTETEKVVQRRHHELSTFNLIPDEPKPALMGWIDQLIDQDLLCREGEYRVLHVTPKGWRVLRSEAEAKLHEVAGGAVKKKTRRRSRKKAQTPVTPSTADALPTETTPNDGYLDTDARALFETLRTLRREIADELNAPAFIVFSDKTLREIARTRPSTKHELLAVKGVGPAKQEKFGQRFLDAIQMHEPHSPQGGPGGREDHRPPQPGGGGQ